MVDVVEITGRLCKVRAEHSNESMTNKQWSATFQRAGIPCSDLAMSIFKGTSKYQTKSSIFRRTSDKCGGLYTMDDVQVHAADVAEMIGTLRDVQHRHSENCKWRKYEEVKRAKAKLEALGYKVI